MSVTAVHLGWFAGNFVEGVVLVLAAASPLLFQLSLHVPWACDADCTSRLLPLDAQAPAPLHTLLPEIS